MGGKRTNYLTWDQYFMGVALLSAERSKDPNTQVGSCIVDKRRRIVGIGYSGFPAGCSDDELPWEREGAFLDTKYAYVCHAELNAILNDNISGIREIKAFTREDLEMQRVNVGIDRYRRSLLTRIGPVAACPLSCLAPQATSTTASPRSSRR